MKTKSKRLKRINYESEDTKEVKNLIFIVIGIVIILVGLYFLTTKSINRQNLSKIEFDYSTCTVGMIFNRPYDEYYVFLYSSENANATKFKSLTNAYSKKENSIKIYTVDLNSNLDNKYLSETSNNNPTSPSDIKIKDSALILIKDGKVSKYYENVSDYEEVLS